MTFFYERCPFHVNLFASSPYRIHAPPVIKYVVAARRFARRSLSLGYPRGNSEFRRDEIRRQEQIHVVREGTRQRHEDAGGLLVLEG
jgi:hypothetical protein